MKSATVWAVMGLVTLAAGCGSPAAAGGAGFAGGLAASKTLEGMQADLAQREAALVEKYNQLVKAGAKAETLEDVRRDIERTQAMQGTVETGKKLLGVDWNDPSQSSRAIGEIGVLAWLLFTRRKLFATEAGVTKFMGQADKEIAGKLYDTIKQKKALG